MPIRLEPLSARLQAHLQAKAYKQNRPNKGGFLLSAKYLFIYPQSTVSILLPYKKMPPTEIRTPVLKFGRIHSYLKAK